MQFVIFTTCFAALAAQWNQSIHLFNHKFFSFSIHANKCTTHKPAQTLALDFIFRISVKNPTKYKHRRRIRWHMILNFPLYTYIFLHCELRIYHIACNRCHRSKFRTCVVSLSYKSISIKWNSMKHKTLRNEPDLAEFPFINWKVRSSDSCFCFHGWIQSFMNYKNSSEVSLNNKLIGLCEKL